jgi:hypothetical protein
MASTEQQVALTVSVDDEHLDDLPKVAARLREAGMQVERALPTIGTITGSVPASKLHAVRATEGVADVEESREYQLPPPDSPIQ